MIEEGDVGVQHEQRLPRRAPRRNAQPVLAHLLLQRSKVRNIMRQQAQGVGATAGARSVICTCIASRAPGQHRQRAARMLEENRVTAMERA